MGRLCLLDPWRSANTIARELKLTRVNSSLHVRSIIWDGLENLSKGQQKQLTDLSIKDSLDVSADIGFPVTMSIVQGEIEAKDFQFVFHNDKGQQVKIGFDSNG